jgi:phosphate transport system substrate-binding protein
MTRTIAGASILLLAGFLFAGGQPERDGEGITSGENQWAWVIETDSFPEVDALKVRGDVIVAGSSTVSPAAQYLAAHFTDEGYGGSISVESIGSGAGFSRFAAGESDIATASAPISARQLADARSRGREPIEFWIGTDALAVVVNPANDWLTAATLDDLAAVFTVDRWNEIDPTWPDAPIQKFVPGTDSGTFSFFVERVFDGRSEPLLTARNVQLSEDDNVLVRGIEGSAYAIGFFGYSYYERRRDRLGVLAVEGVVPGTETVSDKTYPLTRPLFVYSDATTMRASPQVAAFLAYAISYAGEAMDAVGYYPPPEHALESARRKWWVAVDGAF